MKAKIIYGCESRGDAHSPYLVRWKLLETKLGAVYLHRFLRSDADDHHDHPWPFVSVILWRGYVEETAILDRIESFSGTVDECDALLAKGDGWEWGGYSMADNASVFRAHWQIKRRRVWPGMVLFRSAEHRHRVELVNEREAWTLVIRGKYVREWGFFTKRGWQRWKEYFEERGC